MKERKTEMKKVMIDLEIMMFLLGMLVVPARADFGEKEKLSQEIDRKVKIFGDQAGFPAPPVSLTLRTIEPGLVEKVENIHYLALNYQFLSLRSLRCAREFLSEDDVLKTNKYIERADKYYALANSLQRSSIDILQKTISVAQWTTVYKASKTALGFTVTGLGLIASTIFDAGTLYTDYALDKTTMPLEEAKKKLIAHAISNVLLQSTGTSEAVGDMVKHGWGSSRVYPVLQKMMGSSEFKDAVLKEFMRLGGDVGDYVAKEAIDDLLTKIIAGSLEEKPRKEEVGTNGPYIKNINPSSGAPGITTVIEGKNFNKLMGIQYVVFGNKTAETLDWKDEKIIVKVPYGEGAVDVQAEGPAGNSNKVQFVYKEPVISLINPSSGKIKEEVLITGKDFGIKGISPSFRVNFGKSLANVKSWTDTRIVAEAPTDYGTGENDKKMMINLLTYAVYGWQGMVDEVIEKVIKDLLLSGVRIRPSESKIDVDVKVTTPAGKSNSKVFTYQISAASTTPTGDLATALVLDRSGSMQGEKLSKAKEAAQIYVDTILGQKDIASLAAFSNDAQSITEPVLITTGKGTLERDILSLSAVGGTNIGSGLRIALNHLSSCEAKNKTAVLMSDGMNNVGTYQSEVSEFQNKGWQINTVAFGRNADQSALEQIANQTGGSFSPADISNLGSVYHRMNVLAHNGSVFRSYNDFIKTGKKLSYDIPVVPDMKTIGFFTNWQGSKMETILFSPSKTVISRSNVSGFGKFVEGPTYNLFKINNPQCGNWQALITGYDLPPQGEQINFHSFCQSNVFSNILGFQPNYSLNQKVLVGVRLAEVINGRLSPLRGARVTADIKRPSVSLNRFTSGFNQNRLDPTTLTGLFKEMSGLSQKITLFDDGSHGDVNPGDGIYANTYADTTNNGPYLATIDCQGDTSQGMAIKRTLQESFQVGQIEQNSFTVSDFLGLINQQSAGRFAPMPRQMPWQQPKGATEPQTEKIVESLFKQFLKKR